ncbi:hypothetical protein ACJX0J_012120 [Zea mays]
MSPPDVPEGGLGDRPRQASINQKKIMGTTFSFFSYLVANKKLQEQALLHWKQSGMHWALTKFNKNLKGEKISLIGFAINVMKNSSKMNYFASTRVLVTNHNVMKNSSKMNYFASTRVLVTNHVDCVL